jgi:hypothetical protein
MAKTRRLWRPYCTTGITPSPDRAARSPETRRLRPVYSQARTWRIASANGGVLTLSGGSANVHEILELAFAVRHFLG